MDVGVPVSLVAVVAAITKTAVVWCGLVSQHTAQHSRWAIHRTIARSMVGELIAARPGRVNGRRSALFQRYRRPAASSAVQSRLIKRRANYKPTPVLQTRRAKFLYHPCCQMHHPVAEPEDRAVGRRRSGVKRHSPRWGSGTKPPKSWVLMHSVQWLKRNFRENQNVKISA